MLAVLPRDKSSRKKRVSLHKPLLKFDLTQELQSQAIEFLRLLHVHDVPDAMHNFLCRAWNFTGQFVRDVVDV